MINLGAQVIDLYESYRCPVRERVKSKQGLEFQNGASELILLRTVLDAVPASICVKILLWSSFAVTSYLGIAVSSHGDEGKLKAL